MAQDFSFKFLPTTTGWTAASLTRAKTTAPVAQPSAVGPVNGLAQNNLPASVLRTTPSTLVDTSLGSRLYHNPNTGIRDPVASGSVYLQPNLPPFLTQAVSDLNSEQALRRSLQAEWNTRLFQQASSGSPDAYLWQEALRAASVNPGASVAFGQAIQNPAIGRGYETSANAQALTEAQRAATLRKNLGLQWTLQNAQSTAPNPYTNVLNIWEQAAMQNEPANIESLLRQQTPIVTAAAGVPRTNAPVGQLLPVSGWNSGGYAPPSNNAAYVNRIF